MINYLKIVTNKLATDTKMLVADTQREVLAVISDVLALALLGVTYRMSFCCR
jgi:hypothetical protein